MTSLPRFPLLLAVSLCLGSFTSCDKLKELAGGSPEKASPEGNAETARLKTVKDPYLEEIFVFRIKERPLYNSRRFDDLEADAAKFRASKELFGDGSWKLAEFYDSFDCKSEEPEDMWQLHEKIHKDWLAAKPNSITAHVAYAAFLVNYAWHARGSGYADTVTEEGGRLMGERLEAARKLLMTAHALPEKDPIFFRVALKVALGESWPPNVYDDLVTEAVTFEPKYWGYDLSRAYSLLPRWYGQEGDWEAYADKAAARPDGFGPEIYSRIVCDLDGYYGNIFKESKASWPKTKEGLQIMMKKYPQSLDLLSHSAKLARQANDRAMAREIFDKLGDSYLTGAWTGRMQFVELRHWAQEGAK